MVTHNRIIGLLSFAELYNHKTLIVGAWAVVFLDLIPIELLTYSKSVF